jgi:phosphoribosylformylglycinamidine cyclo-ligase
MPTAVGAPDRSQDDAMAQRPADPDHPRGNEGLTYREAGVDIDAGNALVKRIAPAAARTRRPELLGGVGGFAALSRLPERYREPVLVTGTDGVGTKLKLAIDHDRHDEVGQDLVAMCVNDCLVVGAEPLLFLDYYATSRLDVDVAARVITGIAHGCELAGCALAGGETAEMPGFYGDGDYDLAGFCVGVVEHSEIVDGSRVEDGDVLLALAASGPHSNGYSLIRRIVDHAGVDLDADPERRAQLLAPTRIYVAAVRALLDAGVPVHGMAHVTGGGLPENLPRMFTDDAAGRLAFDVDLDSWTLPDVFAWLRQAGGVADLELLRTFNCGVGFVLCVPEAAAARASEVLAGAGEHVWTLGRVVDAGAPVGDGARLRVPGTGAAVVHGELV